jgi:hypothetical protein
VCATILGTPLSAQRATTTLPPTVHRLSTYLRQRIVQISRFSSLLCQSIHRPTATHLYSARKFAPHVSRAPYRGHCPVRQRILNSIDCLCPAPIFIAIRVGSEHIIMLLPRSYMRPSLSPGTSPNQPSGRSSRSSKVNNSTTNGTSSSRSRPKASSTQPKVFAYVSLSSHGSRAATEPVPIPTRTSQQTPPTSQPMTIPSRKRSVVSATMPIRKESRKPRDDHDTLPASVATLLADTAIPPPKTRTSRLKSSASLPRRISIEHLREEWKRDASASSSLGRGSPLDYLLEPSGSQSSLLEDDDMDREPPCSLPSRSISSDSIMSTPSLEVDETTLSPSFSLPMTPNSYMSPSSHGIPMTPTSSVRRAARQDRKVSSPPAEECPDHPLLDLPSDNSISALPTPASALRPSRGPKPSRSTFKSNLTASFQAIRSAAKAFSNFTAPSLPSDDFLTRSLFSTRYASEMRPRNFSGVPDPALRRYLNPTHDYHRMLTDDVWVGDESTNASSNVPHTPMIQLQTYTRKQRRQSAPLPQSQPNQQQSSPPMDGLSFPEFPVSPRQREPRENGDFLRVIVLEMNMRRSGKLDPKSTMHARVWLPPRKSVAPSSEREIAGGVPVRWVGITMDDD